MFFANLAVKRPVTVKMAVLAVLLLGLISLSRLPQELFPAVEYPQVTIATSYKGAAPQEVESLITKLIEESVGTVSGVRKIRSVSKEALSLVMVEFDWGTNMDLASMSVREKIDLIKERLPRGSNEPIVVKYNPFELPVVVVNVTGPYAPSELLEISRNHLKSELEKVPGVASCILAGGLEKEVRVDVDQARLSASGLSILDVVDSIQKSNMNYPAGTIEEEFYEQLIRTVGEFEQIEEIETVPVYVEYTQEEPTTEIYKTQAVTSLEEPAPTIEGQRQFRKKEHPRQKIVSIKDLADVKEALKEQKSISRYNGQDTVSISIQKRAGANVVRVADAIKQKLSELGNRLPKGIKTNITYDQSLFVKQAIRGVSVAALQGGLLAFLVLFFFLRNLRSSIIVALSIPISIMAVFSAMYFRGLSLNMISLGGLALGVGMLVDNAIVVIENISRRRQLGQDPVLAASEGSAEVSSAITSSTITTIIVFLPMIFVAGVAGQLFKELAFTVICALTASLFVALTFIPSLAKDVSSKSDTKKTASTRLFSKIEDIYNNYLSKILTKGGKRLVLGAFIVFIVSIFAFGFLNREFMPAVDQGQFIVKVECVPGTTLKATNDIVQRIEKFLFKFSSIKSITVDIGSEQDKASSGNFQTMGAHQARVMVNLKPTRPLWVLIDVWGNYRDKSSRDIIKKLKNYVDKLNLSGVQIEYILEENVLGRAFAQSAPVVIEVKGYDLDYLRDLTLQISQKLKNIKGIYGIRDSLVLPYPENKITIDKDKSAIYGLSVSDVALTTQTAIEGKVASKFKEEGKEIDIRVRLKEDDRDDIERLRRLIVHLPSGQNITLADIATIEVARGPTEIAHEDKERVVKVWANLDKRSINEVIEDIDKNILSKLDVKENYSVKLAGETLYMQESFKNLRFALLLALILVYMVMAAQFESFLQPLIIMATVPLALIGVVIILLVTGTKISVMVFLGAIVLGGIVVNNGIVLIDYINRLKVQGYAQEDAVLEAAKARLRPIVMTAATTILGLVPLALGLSQGSQLQQPMALTIIGGLLISTFLSLVVIPISYLAVVRK